MGAHLTTARRLPRGTFGFTRAGDRATARRIEPTLPWREVSRSGRGASPAVAGLPQPRLPSRRNRVCGRCRERHVAAAALDGNGNCIEGFTQHCCGSVCLGVERQRIAHQNLATPARPGRLLRPDGAATRLPLPRNPRGRYQGIREPNGMSSAVLRMWPLTPPWAGNSVLGNQGCVRAKRQDFEITQGDRDGDMVRP